MTQRNCRDPVSESVLCDKTLLDVIYSVAHMCILLWIISVCRMRGRRVGQAAVGLGEGEVFLGQSGWSIAVRGEGVAHESGINKRFLWVIFHPVEAQEAQEIHICPKVRGLQNSNFNSVGWNNICHRARLHFCKLVRHMRFIGFRVCFSSI
jgi:hypothetical protein